MQNSIQWYIFCNHLDNFPLASVLNDSHSLKSVHLLTIEHLHSLPSSPQIFSTPTHGKLFNVNSFIFSVWSQLSFPNSSEWLWWWRKIFHPLCNVLCLPLQDLSLMWLGCWGHSQWLYAKNLRGFLFPYPSYIRGSSFLSLLFANLAYSFQAIFSLTLSIHQNPFSSV